MTAPFQPFETRVLRARIANVAGAPRVGRARFIVNTALGSRDLGWQPLSLGYKGLASTVPRNPLGLPLLPPVGLPAGLDVWDETGSYRAGDGVLFTSGTGTAAVNRSYLAVVDHSAASGQTPDVRPDLWAIGGQVGQIPIPAGATIQIEQQIALVTPAAFSLVGVEVDPAADFVVLLTESIDLQTRRLARPPVAALDAVATE